MKKTLYAYIFAFCFMLCIGITSIAAPGDGYELMFRDDFNGSTLNADLWAIRGGAPYGGQNLVENVRVANGKLNLDYTKTNGIYSGGGILTNMPKILLTP